MKAFLHLTYISIKNNFFTFIASTVLIPILMVFYFNFINNTHESQKTVSVGINDEDNSPLSERLVAVLSSEQLKQFLDIGSYNDAEYQIVIPKGYEHSAVNNVEFTIQIMLKKTASSVTAELISSIIKNISADLILNYNISKNISELQNSKRAAEIAAAYTSLQKELLQPIGTITEKKADTELLSYSSYAISFIILIFYTIIMSATQRAYKKKDAGFNMRLVSVPMPPEYILTAKIINTAAESFIAIILYILFFRLLRFAFTGSPIFLFIYAILFSLNCGIISQVLLCFSRKDIIHTVTSISFFIFGVVGVMLGQSISAKNKIIAEILKYNPMAVLTNPLHNIAGQNGLKPMYWNFFIMTVLGTVLYIIGIITVKIKRNRL